MSTHTPPLENVDTRLHFVVLITRPAKLSSNINWCGHSGPFGAAQPLTVVSDGGCAQLAASVFLMLIGEIVMSSTN